MTFRKNKVIQTWFNRKVCLLFFWDTLHKGQKPGTSITCGHAQCNPKADMILARWETFHSYLWIPFSKIYGSSLQYCQSTPAISIKYFTTVCHFHFKASLLFILVSCQKKSVYHWRTYLSTFSCKLNGKQRRSPFLKYLDNSWLQGLSVKAPCVATSPISFANSHKIFSLPPQYSIPPQKEHMVFFWHAMPGKSWCTQFSMIFFLPHSKQFVKCPFRLH